MDGPLLMADPTKTRKMDHLAICAQADVSFRAKTTLLEEVDLIHEALPEGSLAEVDASTAILGKRLSAPLLISAMSGGIAEADEMNRALARVARERGLGLGLGSQRALLEGNGPWPALREGPGDPLLLLGNIGIAQVRGADPRRLADLVSSAGADALCVHLNPAQEWFQPGGDLDFRGSLETLGRLAGALPVPLVVKETGCGISAGCARRLHQAGVRHLDVAGAGGTSWIAVELARRKEPVPGAEDFREWGVPTAASLLTAARTGFDTLIASGGVRSGLDVAKTLALGADASALALPVLKAWRRGGEAAVKASLDELVESLRGAMALAGAPTPADLRGRYVIAGPRLPAWLEGLERAAQKEPGRSVS